MEHDHLFCNLTTIVGSEEDVKARQRMFVIYDKVKNKLDDEVMNISTGSLAEGLDLPGSDVDIMFVIRYGLVVRDSKKDFSGIALRKVFQMIEDEQFPGFVRLKVIHDDDIDEYISSTAFVNLKTGTFLSSKKFCNYYQKKFPGMKSDIHGPCVSDKYQDEDVAFCLKSRKWPRQADKWQYRHRKHEWPNESLIDQITREGCTIVPIGPRYDENNDLHWRVSFAITEKHLVHSFNYTQILCYAMLKLTLKNYINIKKEAKDLLCSYFLKTAVFWVSEELPIETFQTVNLCRCFLLCIDKLITWVECCNCPNYIIQENNMFRGKIHQDNNAVLLKILNEIKRWGAVDLIRLLVDVPDKMKSPLIYPTSKLEFLFYRIGGQKPIRGTAKGKKMINYLDSLATLESSEFHLAIFKHYSSLISQQIVQCPKPEILKYLGNKKRYQMLQGYQEDLLEGRKSDAVSGWLLYACFYYDQGAYSTTLKILDHVVSRFTPNMILIDSHSYEFDQIEDYQLCTYVNLTMNEKMRLSAVKKVCFTWQSSLIPNELKQEVNEIWENIPPVVLTFCLQFLCLHHLGNIELRDKALLSLTHYLGNCDKRAVPCGVFPHIYEGRRDLHDLNRVMEFLSVTKGYLMTSELHSISLTVLGVCYEMAGKVKESTNYYRKALRCDYNTCASATKRLTSLEKKSEKKSTKGESTSLPFLVLRFNDNNQLGVSQEHSKLEISDVEEVDVRDYIDRCNTS